MIKVSVIVPVYNTEKYLRQCLDSLANQTLKEIEIIVINDGSKDNSQVILDEYSSKYNNFKVFVKENGGLSSARNLGIEKSTGKYITFLDSDDFVLSNMYEKMYKKIEEDKSDILVTNLYRYFDERNGVVLKAIHTYSDKIYKNFIIGSPCACGKLYKKSLFNNIKFRTTFYEDLDIIPKLVKYTKKISYLDESFYMYRQVQGSITKQKKFNIKMLDIFTVLDGIYNDLGEEYYDEVEYIYIVHLLRSATLRFLKVENTKPYLNKVVDVINNKFPNYKNNKYYKKSTWKLKLICFLAYHKLWALLKLIGYYIKG